LEPRHNPPYAIENENASAPIEFAMDDLNVNQPLRAAEFDSPARTASSVTGPSRFSKIT
jgi:hypothetical protein